MILISSLFASFYFIFEIDLELLIERLTFAGDQAEGVNYRTENSTRLLSEMLNHNIFFGTGGGSLPFEVRYVKVLHESGIVGLSLILFLSISIVWVMLRIMKRSPESKKIGIPILVGYISFLIGEFTNPFFGSFDYMWMMFLPVAFINVYLLHSMKTKMLRGTQIKSSAPIRRGSRCLI